MKSPFPGMDPYIEECGLFEDFHDDLISEMKHALARAVPEQYIVRTAERPYVVIAVTEGKDEHIFKPDVGIVATNGAGLAATAGAIAVAEAEDDTESIAMRAFIANDYRENFIEIYVNQPERVLVTCIEVLSPANKRPGTNGWDTYLRKRQGLLLGEANFVELDLLRGGERFPMLDPWPNSPYTLLVSHRMRAPKCRVWRGDFRKPLPPIPVPLLTPDSDVTLELQPMVDAIYARSKYARDIDYARPLSKPLTEDEASWFAAQWKH
jgi:hypothetical protein